MACAGLAFAGVADAHTQRYSGHNCVPGSGGELDYGTHGIHSDGDQDLFCPIVKVAGASRFNVVELYTSWGVNQSEVGLYQYDWDGDFASLDAPDTTTDAGTGHKHRWEYNEGTFPFDDMNVVVLRVSSAPNDEVYVYRFSDTGVDY